MIMNFIKNTYVKIEVTPYYMFDKLCYMCTADNEYDFLVFAIEDEPYVYTILNYIESDCNLKLLNNKLKFTAYQFFINDIFIDYMSHLCIEQDRLLPNENIM